jgi:hypothetical protein
MTLSLEERISLRLVAHRAAIASPFDIHFDLLLLGPRNGRSSRERTPGQPFDPEAPGEVTVCDSEGEEIAVARVTDKLSAA